MTTVSATVTGGVTLTSAPYFIEGQESADASGFDPGQTQFSRIWATSAYVGGAVPVFVVPGIVQATLKMYVYDTSQANIEADMATLIDVFTASSYTLTVNVDAASYAWTCYCADYQPAAFPIVAVLGLMWPITFDIPRSPYPVSGPF